MQKVTPELNAKAVQVASGYFLCEELPDGWENLEENVIDKFILDNVWEPLEGRDADSIFALIENAADSTISFLVREGLAEREE